ncbi:Kunitz/Bovine pancreatic trypsin inhibitor domain protein [Ancylostoma caninum]|uniref:Kunitz/Bovine pancreatic trypsin inhibitor domain protein n=1 Tax=Ancylostoma caninum TaxID=29170 RepID=A0A368GQQ9_ANCCA|nr:Kunitz/Bovine pancreatic trypsin inhibitor domain protein [Ancylostoma caninum]
MKSSAVILFVIIYCCTAAPPKNPKCLDGPHEDNTVGFCDFNYQYRYYYNKDSGKCEWFLFCFQKGNNQFNSYEDCKKECME